ncbi:MAG: substrate-binding domain-containing protein [Rhodobacteraceae bacterium]|nr:substrate-binding domain-containing protein [Paracoccaceae bacterium]
MNNSPTPTLEDVAREAGVSTATVSRCLNTPDRVVESTRKRVLSVVLQLGYSPNFGARALAAKRTNTIGAVIPTMENAVFAKGIQAFQEELGKHGYTLLISSSSYQEDLEAGQIRTLVSRGADGLLLIGNHRNKEIYGFLEQQSIPTLTSWIYDINNEIPSVGFDNKLAMKELATEVIKYGHLDIAAISANQATNDRARARMAGIREAMAEHGLDPGHLRLIEVPYGIETGGEAFATLASSPNRPTVVMCANDVLAAGALCQARRMRLRVPDDISITGFDDIELATVVEPAMTTVHVPHSEMGRKAAQLLIGMVNGEYPSESTQLATHLCLRGSLGPKA